MSENRDSLPGSCSSGALPGTGRTAAVKETLVNGDKTVMVNEPLPIACGRGPCYPGPAPARSRPKSAQGQPNSRPSRAPDTPKWVTAEMPSTKLSKGGGEASEKEVLSGSALSACESEPGGITA